MSETLLNDTQQEIVRALWDKEDLTTVACKVFGVANLEANSPEVKVVKAFIASIGQVSKPKKPAQKGPVTLTDAQKNNIRALLDSDRPPSTREIVKTIFPDLKNFTPLNAEYRAIHTFITGLNQDSVDMWDEPVEHRRYRAPKTLSAVIGLVNRYVMNPKDPQRALYDAANMKAAAERNLKALFTYLNAHHFVSKATLFDRKAERELFESTFVRHVHDKADTLIPEDVDMYIAAANETVYVSQLERMAQGQKNLIQQTLEGEDDGHGSKAKLSMSLVETNNSLLEKLDKAKARLKGLLESVADARNKRIDSKANSNDNLTNLLNLWTEEETRNKLIELGKLEHDEDVKEFDRLRDLDDMMALIAGFSREEAGGGV